jgi:hypothetical protein
VKTFVAFVTTLAVLGASAAAGDEAENSDKGKWVPISEKLVAALEKISTVIPFPGNTGGVAVDRTNGDLYLALSGNGIWKSSDQGKTYVRVDRENIGGRAETGFSLDADPDGKRLMCFMAEGNCGMILDSGEKVVKSSAPNMDYGAVDWTEGKAAICVRHNTKGWGWISSNGGESWKDAGPGFACVGVFDENTFVVTKTKEPGIFRSEDAGTTWTKVSEFVPNGRAMRVFKGVGYWTSKDGLLVSKDKGATWAVQGAALECSYGPYFGKDEDHIIAGGKTALMETADGGKHWKEAAPYPEKMKYEARGWFGNFAWDPQKDILYASLMGRPAYKYER